MWTEYDFARYNVTYNDVSKKLEIDTMADRTLQPSNDFHIRGNVLHIDFVFIATFTEPYHPLRVYYVNLDPSGSTNNYKMYLFFFRERKFGTQQSNVVSKIDIINFVGNNYLFYLLLLYS